MGIELYGIAAQSFLEGLALERGLAGDVRRLANGTVKLDSIIAWRRHADGSSVRHTLDGSRVHAVYEAGFEPTDAQRAATAPARAAGIDTRIIDGRLIDVRPMGIHSIDRGLAAREMTGALLLCTNGFRTPPADGVTFRQISTRVGLVVAVAFEQGLSVSVEEAYRLAGEQYVAAWRVRREQNRRA